MYIYIHIINICKLFDYVIINLYDKQLKTSDMQLGFKRNHSTTVCSAIYRLPRTRFIFTESCLLYKLIKLINFTQTNNPEILEKIHEKTHTYFEFNFNITRIYLSTYTYECTMPICFKCGFLGTLL